MGLQPEARKELKSGNIEGSKNVPFSELIISLSIIVAGLTSLYQKKINIYFPIILALGGGGQNEVASENATHVITKGEFSMSPDQKETTITPTICLEESKRYNITFTFTQYSSTPDPSAIINIDSVSASY